MRSLLSSFFGICYHLFMGHQIKFIFTDLDGVIRYFPLVREVEIEHRFGLPRASIGAVAFEAGLLAEVITGQISDEEWRNRISTSLALQFPHIECQSTMSVWSDFHGDIDHRVLDYLKSLAATRSLGLLTNATSRLNSDLRKAGIFAHFSHIFNSSEIGTAKPHPDVYMHVCDKLQLDPEQIVFIDDSLGNVEVAKQVGFHAFHFQGLDDLKVSIKQTLGPL